MNKLLFLAHRIPYPPDKGDKIRAWHILRHLMQTHQVYVGCLVDDEADFAHVPALRAMCADLACFRLRPRWQRVRALSRLRPGRPLTLDYFDHPKLRRWVRQTITRERIDRVFVFCSAMAPYVMDVEHTRRVMDFIDVDSAKWTEYASRSAWPMRAIWAREGDTLLAFEREVAARFDRSLFVSAHERDVFSSLAPECADRAQAMSNGVDFDYFSRAHTFTSPYREDSLPIVFTGAMDYRPNIDAAAWFAREVFPIVRQTVGTQAEFWIVGTNPTGEVRQLDTVEGVVVTGRVPDTRPYLRYARAAVAPLRIARGIQNKVLEAMAMALPVIATPDAFEGIDAEPGHDLLLADTAGALAQHVIDVIRGQHPELGTNARRAVEARYDWSTRLALLDTLWQQQEAVAEPSTAHLLYPETAT